jgi:adenylate cyclase
MFSKGIKPLPLINFLNMVFTKFDSIAKIYNVEKIKTIGDGYMAAAGKKIYFKKI